ncbi:MAG: hypothetical protein R2738_07370 [Bacteroides graminisolvens]
MLESGAVSGARGDLLLFFKIGLSIRLSGWLVRSKDGGKHGVSVNRFPKVSCPVKN